MPRYENSPEPLLGSIMKKKRRKPKILKKDALEKYLEIIEDDALDSPLVEGRLERDAPDLVIPDLGELFLYQFWMRSEDSVEIWNIPNQDFWEKWNMWKSEFRKIGIRPYKDANGNWTVYAIDPSYFYLFQIE